MPYFHVSGKGAGNKEKPPQTLFYFWAKGQEGQIKKINLKGVIDYDGKLQTR